MEVLNALLAEADCRGVLRPLPDKIRSRTSIYADDLVILLSPDAQDFINVRRILDTFAGASALPPTSTSASSHPSAARNRRWRRYGRSFLARFKNSLSNTLAHLWLQLGSAITRNNASLTMWLLAFWLRKAASS
jgi:hypothetical protein